MNKVNAEELMTIRRNLNYTTTKELKNLYCYDRRETNLSSRSLLSEFNTSNKR